MLSFEDKIWIKTNGNLKDFQPNDWYKNPPKYSVLVFVPCFPSSQLSPATVVSSVVNVPSCAVAWPAGAPRSYRDSLIMHDERRTCPSRSGCGSWRIRRLAVVTTMSSTCGLPRLRRSILHTCRRRHRRQNRRRCCCPTLLLLRPRRVCVSVWLLSFCLSDHLRISKITRPNFTEFSVHVTVAVAWSSSDDNAIVLCTSGFVDGVVFSYNAGNRPESKTLYVSTSSPSGSTGRS